jgi:hypothetical protein
MGDERGTVYLGEAGQEFTKISTAKLKALLKSPLISSQIDCKAATGYTNAVYVPAGAIVKAVGVIADTALSGGSGDIDVGDSTTVDLYIDGLTALAANQIAMGGEAGTNAADPHGGKYYSAETAIRVRIIATAAAGSIRVLVWYDIDDSGIYT